MPTVIGNGLEEAGVLVSRRTIPFDYAFRFALQGVPENVENSVVTVSIEAAFVAISIGFGIIPQVTPITFRPAIGQAVAGIVRIAPGSVLEAMPFLGSLAAALGESISVGGPILPKTAAALSGGIRLKSSVVKRVVALGVNVNLSQHDITDFLEVVPPPAQEIQFKYSIFDEGSGREFQSEPILSTAGLGISNGERPFRHFAVPIYFVPRSTIRMQVTEVSEFPGTLHVSLQGYKVLGGPGTPTGRVQRQLRRGARR